MPNATGAATSESFDPTTFCRLSGLGLVVTGQRLDRAQAGGIGRRVVEPDVWCHAFWAERVFRDTMTRQLAHQPFG